MLTPAQSGLSLGRLVMYVTKKSIYWFQAWLDPGVSFHPASVLLLHDGFTLRQAVPE